MSLESLDDYPTRSVPNIFIALATSGMQVLKLLKLLKLPKLKKMAIWNKYGPYHPSM